MRRLAGDHAALHTSELPPNYLFAPQSDSDSSSDLTSLDILLAGPTSTPYENGVFKLHLTIPDTYPNEAPKAFFRTKIFHPNVDDNTGAVCVETLKRDWDAKLTLRDILVTISCLLVVPNASSALNADAGMLLEQGEHGWQAFEKRARFMTSLHAGVPKDLKQAVQEAQSRGNDEVQRDLVKRQDTVVGDVEARRGKTRRNLKATPVMQTPIFQETPEKMDSSPTMASPEKQRHFVVQSRNDDVFGIRIPPPEEADDTLSDSELQDADQENNNNTISTDASIFPSPIRQGPPVPLGELCISDDSFESEYPPSPKKSPFKRHQQQHQQATDDSFDSDYPRSSPRKSPVKRVPQYIKQNQEKDTDMTDVGDSSSRAESSRTAELRHRPNLFTPPQGLGPAAEGNEEEQSSSHSQFTIRKPDRPTRARRAVALAVNNNNKQKRFQARTTTTITPEDPFNGPRLGDRIVKQKSKTVFPVLIKSREEAKREEMEAKLWQLCGEDVERWNKGDFGGYFKVKAARW